MIHLTLCFDEGTGNQVMTGGFLTDKQAANGWMFKLSEWTQFSSYEIGLRSGSSASHILVCDRRKKRLVEESWTKVQKRSYKACQRSSARKWSLLNLLKIYQNLLSFSRTRSIWKKPNTLWSILRVETTEHDDISVCAADCRLMAFKTVDDSLRFWIKGRNFSIQGLLGNEACSSAFIEGTLVIFRLAPQDYHRFHSPVSGAIEKFVNIPGCLYTVNPIAVNSKHCNVFTENKRVVCTISTADFGKVAFVAIGATMVGSITFSKQRGDHVKKGDELCYFSFGGSTVICVFEKGKIKIDEDILQNSERSLETLVTVGMQLGVGTKKHSGLLPSMEKLGLDD